MKSMIRRPSLNQFNFNSRRKSNGVINGSLLVLLLIMITEPSRSADFNLSALVGIKGQCKSFVVSGANYKCSSIIYSSFKNDRVMFTVATPDGAISLSGGKDSQLRLIEYILQVDTIRIGSGDSSVRSYPSEGICKMNVTEDGSVIHSIRCSASNGLESVSIDFIGDNVHVKHFESTSSTTEPSLSSNAQTEIESLRMENSQLAEEINKWTNLTGVKKW